MEWSEEYCNLTHLGNFDLKKTWVTVERLEKIAILRIWFPGCQCSPKEIIYPNVHAAKLAGNKIIKKRG